MPDGPTANTHVANACLPAGQLLHNKPILISDFNDTCSFLACLRTSCPGGLKAELKCENLIVVRSTANGFRAVVSALRFLHGKDVVNFHTFTLPEERCGRRLVNNLSRVMPESVIREDRESLNFRVQAVTQLQSGRRDQYPTKDSPPNPHFMTSVARGL